jgi:hypothetical protein
MTIPLMSEFLTYAQSDTDADKQDCERNAFKRLARRLKAEFKRLPIMVLLDGLYPNGPVVEICRRNNWQFMTVLQDKSLISVWEEYEGLKKLLPQNHHQKVYKGRKPHFRWVNDIEYYYDIDQKQVVHVIVCGKRVRGFIDFVRETLTGPWLDIDWLQTRLSKPYQLRLI